MKRAQSLFFVLAMCLAIMGCQKDPDALVENSPPVVMAGADTSFELSKKTPTLQLSGSAHDSDGAVAAYLWSQVSGPTNAIIASPGSAATTISGFAAGTYVFQLMATDEDGAVGVDALTVTVTAPKLITVSVSPSNNPTETVIASLYGGNNALLQELPAGYWTNGGTPVESRSLLKFDFSTIPSGATIVSAKLSLYAVPNPVNGDQVHAHTGLNNAVNIRRITSNWNTGTLSWANQPATSQTHEAELPVATASFQNYTDIDIADLVQDMVSDGNYGLMLQLKELSMYNIQNFASSKHADATKHPRLVVQYTN